MKNDSELYKLYNVASNKDELKGVNNKNVIKRKNRETGEVETGMFKERMNTGSKDNVMEAVTYRLARILGVPCVKARVTMIHGEIGAFSKFEYHNKVNFKHAVDVIGDGTVYEMSAEELFIRNKDIKTNQSKMLQLRMLQYIVFDYIMAQRDRHLENLAYIISNREVTLYPLYDNGFCCESMISNTLYDEYVKSKEYSGRMGNSNDILESIRKEKERLGIDSLGKILTFSKNFSTNTIKEIILSEDIYNQMTEKRAKRYAKYIIERAGDIYKL